MQEVDSIIYFDNAATSYPKPSCTIEAMINFHNYIGANPGRSGHKLSVEAGRIIYNARETIAKLFNINDPLNIIFTKNATEALNIAMFSLLKPGDHVITSSLEHNSVLRPLKFLENKGVELSIIDCINGIFPLDKIKKFIKPNTKAMFITHVSNVTGTVFPIKEISKIAKENNIILCIDAAQSAGVIPIDVNDMHIDLLAFTGHKSLYSPQGTGGLYIREELINKLEPFILGGTGSNSEYILQPDFAPDKFESGTPNTIGLAGLEAGVNYILEIGIENIYKKEIELTSKFLEGLKEIKGVKVYGDNQRLTSIVSFNILNLTPSEVAFILDDRFNIMCRPGLHCAPLAHKSIGTYPQGTVRFSFGYFNTLEQINKALECIEVICYENRR